MLHARPSRQGASGNTGPLAGWMGVGGAGWVGGSGCPASPPSRQCPPSTAAATLRPPAPPHQAVSAFGDKVEFEGVRKLLDSRRVRHLLGVSVPRVAPPRPCSSEPFTRCARLRANASSRSWSGVAWVPAARVCVRVRVRLRVLSQRGGCSRPSSFFAATKTCEWVSVCAFVWLVVSSTARHQARFGKTLPPRNWCVARARIVPWWVWLRMYVCGVCECPV
jgi:hypothetical protein